MKFTLSWLKTHLDTDAPLDQITATLTRIGLELEDVDDRGAALAPFRIARVTEAMAASKAVAEWFGPVFLEAYLRHKRSEMHHVAEWAVNELCNRYAEVY